MPFLLGFFGNIKESQKIRISSFLREHVSCDTLQCITFQDSTLCAGYKKDEENKCDTVIPLAKKQGFFVGNMFNRSDFDATTFSLEDTQELIENPNILCKKWWGQYSGVFYNQKKEKCTLVRDPQGLYTLFYIIQKDSIIFSTELFFLYSILQEKPKLLESYFLEYIIGQNCVPELTPFVGIKELLPGTGLSFSLDGSFSMKQLWDVSSYHGSFISNVHAFEEELLEILKLSIKAWTKNASGICLELSGGTDSSGLLILLKDLFPEKNIIAVNLFDSNTPSSNEIEYAKEVTDLCDVPLHFIDWQDSLLLDSFSKDCRLNKPSTFFLFASAGQQLHELAKKNNCSMIINGQGGDHVFLAPEPIESLADYWLEKGISGISVPLKQLSASNRMPWWMLIKKTYKDIVSYYRKENNNKHDEKFPYLHESAYAYIPKNNFYLHEQITSFYPAKKEQVKSLFHASFYADRNQRIPGQTIIHPLLSQPIVELGLKIPTYQSFSKGFDRIFFRNAVTRIKKSGSLWRNSKGETSGSMAKSFTKQAKEIQNIMLSGYCIKNNLLKKSWFSHELAKVQHGYSNTLWPITRVLTVELWIKQWQL